MKVKKLE